MYLKPSQLSFPISNGLTDSTHVLHWEGDHNMTVKVFEIDDSTVTGLVPVAKFTIYGSLRHDFIERGSHFDGGNGPKREPGSVVEESDEKEGG